MVFERALSCPPAVAADSTSGFSAAVLGTEGAPRAGAGDGAEDSEAAGSATAASGACVSDS